VVALCYRPGSSSVSGKAAVDDGDCLEHPVDHDPVGRAEVDDDLCGERAGGGTDPRLPIVSRAVAIRRLSATAAVPLTMLAIAVTIVGGQEGDRTFLAVARADGALVPIAISDGQEWWNRWPWAVESDEVKALPVPATLDKISDDWLPAGVRLPVEWTMQRQDGRRRKVRLQRPIRPPGWQMMETIALQSDYHVSPDKGGNQYSFDEIGIAIAGVGELSAFATASPAESRRILGRLNQRLLEIEQAEIARWLQQRRESPGGDPRPITLSRTYHDPAPRVDEPFGLVRAVRRFKGRTYYYLTGEKLFKMGLKDLADCKMNLSFDGIVITRSDGTIVFEKLNASAYAEYCGDAASWMTPLAVVERRDRVIWVVKYSVEDGYNYGLFDPEANENIALKGSWDMRN
jgi:hypothetical protein